jgi:tight adherence protein C
LTDAKFAEMMAQYRFIVGVAYALVFLGAFILARAILAEQESRAAQENLSDRRELKSSNGLVQLTRPFFSQYVVPMIRNRPFWEERKRNYRKLLISAGLRDELTADEFVAFKIFNIVMFPLLGAFLKAGGLIDASGWIIMAAGVAGFFYPDFWVKGCIEERQKKIGRALPFIIDLLALSMEAGLDFIGAVGKVVEKASPSPLVDEFSQLLKEMRIGSSRDESMREMASRINMREMNSFVAVLVSSNGVSIGEILRQQSEQIRVDRMLKAEKAGAAAASKVLLPLVLFILPAVMLMIGGPFGLGFIYPDGAPR